jgi:hypothetical protein
MIRGGHLRAFSLPLLLGWCLLAGCGRSNPTGTWDAAAMMWEAAPPREIVDGAESDGGPGGMMPRSFDKPCKMAREPWCCYDGTNVTGFPFCSWKGLGAGASSPIDTVLRGNERVTLPSPLTLTSTTPDRSGTGEDCRGLQVGFVLEGKGLSEEPMVSSILYYDIKKDGTWAPAGAGGESTALVVPSSTDASERGDAGTGSLPTASEKLDDEQCPGTSDVVANVVLFDWVRFKLDDVDYEANFSRSPQAETSAFYVRIERSF